MITSSTQQYLKEDLLIFSRRLTFFFSHCFLFAYLFPDCHAHKNVNLYQISYTLRFCYVKYVLVDVP